MATAPHLIPSLSNLSPEVAAWVESVRQLTQPKAVRWCEGSDAEVRELTAKLVKDGELAPLNAKEFPGCHLARSSPSDGARVEHLPFIAGEQKDEAGPNNTWMPPGEAPAKRRALFAG